MRTTDEKEAGRIAFEEMVEKTEIKEKYEESRKEIQKLLEKLDQNQKRDPKNWGYVDLINRTKFNLSFCINDLIF